MKPRINLKNLMIARKMLFTTEELKNLLTRLCVLPDLIIVLSEVKNIDDVKSVVFIDALQARGNVLVTLVVNYHNTSDTFMDRLVVPYIGVVK